MIPPGPTATTMHVCGFYQMDQWSVGGSASAPQQIVQTCFLTDYDQDLVWLCPRVSRFFAAPQPIVLEIPQWDR